MVAALSTFFAWLLTGTNGFLFASGASAFMFIVMVAVFLINAIRKVDLTRMFYEPGTTVVSASKFWHVVAYFVATIAFLFINITAPGSASLEFIWLTYLAVIAGSASVQSLITARYSGNNNAPQMGRGDVGMMPYPQPSYPQPMYPPEPMPYPQPMYPQPSPQPYYGPAYPHANGMPEPMMTPAPEVEMVQPVKS